jgi:hypothetical protein
MIIAVEFSLPFEFNFTPLAADFDAVEVVELPKMYPTSLLIVST